MHHLSCNCRFSAAWSLEMGQQAAGSTRESVSRQLGQALRGRADCPPERRSCLAVGPSLLAMINALLAGFVRCQGAGAELGREGGVHQGSEATAGGCVAGTLGAPLHPRGLAGLAGRGTEGAGCLNRKKNSHHSSPLCAGITGSPRISFKFTFS